MSTMIKEQIVPVGQDLVKVEIDDFYRHIIIKEEGTFLEHRSQMFTRNTDTISPGTYRGKYGPDGTECSFEYRSSGEDKFYGEGFTTALLLIST